MNRSRAGAGRSKDRPVPGGTGEEGAVRWELQRAAPQDQWPQLAWGRNSYSVSLPIHLLQLTPIG